MIHFNEVLRKNENCYKTARISPKNFKLGFQIIQVYDFTTEKKVACLYERHKISSLIYCEIQVTSSVLKLHDLRRYNNIYLEGLGGTSGAGVPSATPFILFGTGEEPSYLGCCLGGSSGGILFTDRPVTPDFNVPYNKAPQ